MIGTLLFFHLVAAVTLFAGFGIELAALVLLHRAKSLADVRAALAPMPLVGPLMISGVLIILVAGISLVYAAGYGWQAWDAVALVLTVALAITGKTINGGRGEVLYAKVQPLGDGPIPAEIDAARRDPIWNYFMVCNACEVIALLYIMSSKPTLTPTLFAVIVAALVAFIPMALLIRRPQPSEA